MATTVSTIVAEVEAELEGKRRSLRTKLNGAVTTGDTQITCDSLVEVRAGDYLGINDELLYVEAKASVYTADVARAEHGSTAASHSDNDRVTIQPKWWRHKILEKLKEEVNNLPDDIYGEDQVSVSVASETRFVELTPSNANLPVIDVLEVRRDPENARDVMNRVPVELIRDIENSQFTSGYGIQLKGGWTYGGAETLFVTLAVGRDTSTFVSGTDLEATVGLSVNVIQAVKYGTIWRMNATREIQRSLTDAMGQSRRAEEVQPMQIAQTALQFDVLRDRLLDDERARLVSKWGGRIG